MHVGERTAFDLEHAMRGKVAEPAIQAAECIPDRGRRDVNRDVALGLHGQEWREPARFNRMAGEAAHRMSNEHVVADADTVRVLVPIDCGVETVRHHRWKRLTLQSYRPDADRRQPVDRVCACGVELLSRRAAEDHKDLACMAFPIAELLTPV